MLKRLIEKIKSNFNFKSESGLLGVSLAMFYVGMMVTYITTIDLIIRVEITGTDKFLTQAKAYYAARAGFEYMIAQINTGAVTTDATVNAYHLGKVLNRYDLYFDIVAYQASAHSSTNQLGRLCAIPGSNSGQAVFMLSSTGYVIANSVEEARKSIQCLYFSSANKVIAWRELWRVDNDAHKYLANHSY